jgi:hypothetical protein
MTSLRRGQFLKNAVTLLITVVICLGIAEAALRLMPSLVGISLLHRMEPELRTEIAGRLGLPTAAERVRFASADRTDGGPDIFLYKPDWPYFNPVDPEDAAYGAVEVVPMDARGYCNTPEKAQRATADVVFIGDSFPFCTSIAAELTAASQIERMTGIRIYNLAIAGIGPYEYLELLRRDGLALEPKVVVLHIYEGNDLRDIDRYLDFMAGERRSCDEKCETGGSLISKSYALSFLVAAIKDIASQVRRLGRDDFRYTVETRSGPVMLNVSNSDQDEISTGRRVQSGDIVVSVFGPPLAAFAGLARERGFVPIIVYIPSGYTAYNASVRFEDPEVGAAVQALSKAQRSFLAGAADELGIEYLDLTAAFEAAVSTTELTHFPSNVHLTPTGQCVVAMALAPTLERALGRPVAAVQCSPNA